MSYNLESFLVISKGRKGKEGRNGGRKGGEGGTEERKKA